MEKRNYLCVYNTSKYLCSFNNRFYSFLSNDFFTLKDDGRVSTISAASYMTRDAIENFYSCHIHHYRNKSFKDSSRILLSFGVTVIDRNKGDKVLLIPPRLVQRRFITRT